MRPWAATARSGLSPSGIKSASSGRSNSTMNRSNWFCLDCGKDTFENNEDYYVLRNRLWRSLVPRAERHGMLCRACVERRLGRPLAPEDFWSAGTDDESDPQDQPMQREDYGIIDSLTPEMLHAIDSAMIELVSSSPRKVIAIARYMLEKSPAAVPGLHDWFYMDRIGELIEDRALVVVAEGKDHRFHIVAAAAGLSGSQ